MGMSSLPPATKLGQGYVFTGVCDSVNKGGVCLSACLDTHPLGTDTPWEQTAPWEQTPPRADTPWEQTPPRADTPQSRHPMEQTPHGSRHLPEQTPPRSRHPWEQTPPEADTPLGADSHRSRHPPPEQTPPEETPPCIACWEIRSTHERYASYWNAISF